MQDISKAHLVESQTVPLPRFSVKYLFIAEFNVSALHFLISSTSDDLKLLLSLTSSSGLAFTLMHFGSIASDHFG